MTIWYIRHAESMAALGRTANGDSELSPRGIEQAKAIKLPKASIFFISPLWRALQTFANAGWEPNDGEVMTIASSILREAGVNIRNEGGTDRSILEQTFLTIDHWDLHVKWPNEIKFPESEESLHGRVQTAKVILQAHKEKGTDVAVIGHGAFYRNLTGGSNIGYAEIVDITDKL